MCVALPPPTTPLVVTDDGRREPRRHLIVNFLLTSSMIHGSIQTSLIASLQDLTALASWGLRLASQRRTSGRPVHGSGWCLAGGPELPRAPPSGPQARLLLPHVPMQPCRRGFWRRPQSPCMPTSTHTLRRRRAVAALGLAPWRLAYAASSV